MNVPQSSFMNIGARMLKNSFSKTSSFFVLALSAMILGTTVGCASGNIGAKVSCSGFSCQGYEEGPGHQHDDPQGTQARNMHKLQQAEREAQQAEERARQAELQAELQAQQAEQQGAQEEGLPEEMGIFGGSAESEKYLNTEISIENGKMTVVASCCLNGHFYTCPTAAASEACFENFAPGECVSDFSRNAECNNDVD